MKVLIAEDDLISLRILDKNLNDWGYEVMIARSGGEAWEHLRDADVRLAILDWMMPGMNGIELCQKIRRRRKSRYTYIILLSAKDRKQDIILGLSSGADDYMTKPVNFLELKARLQTGRRIVDLEDKLLVIQNQLKDMASRDSLTKIWNRTETLRFLREEIERGAREGKSTGLIMLDIDYFKKINDLYGHDAGDKAILFVVSRLKKKIRKSDKIGRYGGDEFIVILPRCGPDEIIKIGERLRSAVGNRGITTNVDRIPLSISVGCAVTDSSNPMTAENLIKQSDEALREAKNRGRNCVYLKETSHPDIKRRANG